MGRIPDECHLEVGNIPLSVIAIADIIPVKNIMVIIVQV